MDKATIQELQKSSLAVERKVYLLLTRFSDNGSKTIGALTKYYYTHASIGLEEDMNTFLQLCMQGIFGGEDHQICQG